MGQPSMTDAQRIVIDTDPGVDDALALLIALTARELDVRALTIVGGNCAVDQCVRNALGILELIGSRDVPVARGADRPLLLESVL
ncbi:MAG: nucleoside hydrolase, partial [Sciscionella sp.]